MSLSDKSFLSFVLTADGFIAFCRRFWRLQLAAAAAGAAVRLTRVISEAGRRAPSAECRKPSEPLISSPGGPIGGSLPVAADCGMPVCVVASFPPRLWLPLPRELNCCSPAAAAAEAAYCERGCKNRDGLRMASRAVPNCTSSIHCVRAPSRPCLVVALALAMERAAGSSSRGLAGQGT